MNNKPRDPSPPIRLFDGSEVGNGFQVPSGRWRNNVPLNEDNELWGQQKAGNLQSIPSHVYVASSHSISHFVNSILAPTIPMGIQLEWQLRFQKLNSTPSIYYNILVLRAHFHLLWVLKNITSIFDIILKCGGKVRLYLAGWTIYSTRLRGSRLNRILAIMTWSRVKKENFCVSDFTRTIKTSIDKEYDLWWNQSCVYNTKHFHILIHVWHNLIAYLLTTLEAVWISRKLTIQILKPA